MFGAGNNVVLDVFPEIREVSTIAGHADHEGGIIFGMFLRIDQDRFIKAIELNMGNAQIIQGRADQIGEFLQSGSFEMQFAELVIQKVALFRRRPEFPAGFHEPTSRGRICLGQLSTSSDLEIHIFNIVPLV